MENLLEMQGITKAFFGVTALNNVSFKLKAGTVHALMGENGAGKSTLMKILSGMLHADHGKIIFKGKEVHIDSPLISIKMGITMIHQELTPISEMTIAENVFLGREPTKNGLIDAKKLNQMTKEVLNHIGIELNPQTIMKDLKVSDMQLVEIAKAVSYNSEIIIMDEPTSAITKNEVRKLFKIINELRNSGKSIIYISHKMDEVFEISDYITVFRDGQYVDTKEGKEINPNDIIKMMVGRELKDVYPVGNSTIGDILFSFKGMTQGKKFKGISFNVRKGEILGIAGLMGAGRTEVMEAIFGLTELDAGEIFIEGKKVQIKSPKDAIDNGIAFVTEDRKLHGLVLPLSVKENITMPSLDKISKKGFINDKKEQEITDKYIKSLRVKTSSREQIVQSLSGGNQQKVILAKWLMAKPKLLILDEPTRGIDIGSKSEIYKLMKDIAEEGYAIIMISSELPEILGISDRILVFSHGEITGELSKEEASQEKIMNYAMKRSV